ncbi:Rab-GTPase-TBC domain-containing protein [Artemisia annua]|uniref:Rab-GTPase-TBC domain-containing protein n=1 Tax=Artemisia annua TaxID=35608 RepID=A0A2U1NKA4_ARTAN|nr:Rab-GTPase-TBC domain-containing protein [Artemisia annua]
MPEISENNNNNRRFWDLRGVQWRMDLGVLPPSDNSDVDHVRRLTANSRRSYASLRRRLLIDPLIPKDGSNFPDVVIDNPLSQDPGKVFVPDSMLCKSRVSIDSMWGQFFQKAELEKMVDQDLSRLYPEHGSYFQTPGCQGMLRRILLLWCITHPNYGYRQGMHELLAPLLYVLQADVERLSAVRKLYKHYFTDNFDGLSFHETDSAYVSNLKQISQHIQDDSEIQENQIKVNNLNELDPKIQTIISFSDAYGAEGELGIVLSEKFMEHDAYCMFDALMNGSNGAVSMASFFSPSPLNGPQNGLPPVIEASSVLYHLLAIVDSSLYTHLIELGVEPQYFALRWLRVLFGREFALEDLLVIWDEIFSFDNTRLSLVSENNPEESFEVLNSSRGAFIAALAVSMILYVRSSVLSTETATSCLQRLLNFPQDVNLGKLLKKAHSLVTVAIDAMKTVPLSMFSDGFHERTKPTSFRTHSLSSDAAAPGSPLSIVREKKVKSRLLRTESDPSSSKVYSEKTAPGLSRRHVRKSLLDDLSRQLGFEDDNENDNLGVSEENSSIFSDPPSPIADVNDNDHDHENDTEQSSEAPMKAGGSNLKLIAGKFQWFWKFGKNGGEGSSEKGDSTNSSVVGCDQKSEAAASVTDVTNKEEHVNQNKMSSLKNLGQSMVENLQVIESLFQHEKGETGQVDNLSKKALVDRGQMTAMAALKELRKISHILSEM